MAYVDPKTVTAPRKFIRSVDVLYDSGPDEPAGWSLAWLSWNGERTIGIRWNGGEDSGMGAPQSCGHPTWLVIPRELQQVVLDRVEELSLARQGGLLEGYREMANDAEHEAEALEWSEALMPDATSQER